MSPRIADALARIEQMIAEAEYAVALLASRPAAIRETP